MIVVAAVDIAVIFGVVLFVARLLPVLRHRRVSPLLRRRQVDALAGTAVRAEAHVLLVADEAERT